MVGRVGLEPTYPEGGGFTVPCNCRYATDPYNAFPTDLLSAGFLASAASLNLYHFSRIGSLHSVASGREPRIYHL